MKNNALILCLLVAIVALGNSVAFGQSLAGKRFQLFDHGQFATAKVLNPESALPAGIYTVGQSGQFPTIDSAFNKLHNDGVLGPVTLTLIDTLYQTQSGRRFELGPIAGSGPNARVTIRPAVNTRATIRGDSTAVLTFTNVKYLTLDGRSDPPSSSAGITVHALYKPASAWNNCIEAWGDADYNQILYLTLKTDDFRNVSPGGGVCVALAGSGTAVMPDSNLIEGNQMSGIFGVYITAWVTFPSIRPRGNIIRGNTYGQISDLHGAWGIQSEICEGTLIEGNTVQFMRGTYLTTNDNRTYTIGINAYRDLNTTIRDNVVHAVYASNSAELYGILGSGGTDGTGTGLLIYNNMVYDLQNTSTTGNACIEGMCLWYNINNQIFYNTVYLSGTGANPNGVDALGLDPSVTNTTLRNNIFVNFYHQTAGLTPTALWANGILTSDYNDLCADTTLANSYTAHLGTTYYRRFSDWQGAGYDPHSLSVLPVFRTPHVHLDSTSAATRQLNGRAIVLAGISTDIDGEARHASTPDIGADEMWLTSDVPSPPLLVSPLGTTDEPRDALMVWHALPSATSYRLQVALDSAFATIVVDSAGTDTLVHVHPLAANTKFYWRVSASNQGGTGSYSAIGSYTTGDKISAVAERGGIPKEFGLAQNYPNPFNPSTTIKFELPKASDVRLCVYDMLGREVSVLVNERKDAGVHEVKFDGSNLASGVYFYRLRAGDFVQTKNLLLVH